MPKTLISFKAVVEIHDVKSIQKLMFVFMKLFDLMSNSESGSSSSPCSAKILRASAAFFLRLTIRNALRAIVLVALELREFGGIPPPFWADVAIEQSR